ncbi:hypothetical protein O3P69_015382 [Scylla paramamosain]|uniref:Uncharacterized protein n=1 Tax=Scylla paramamosain TaxID=85552 RepID=A0AAW0T4V2_SCYPA
MCSTPARDTSRLQDAVPAAGFMTAFPSVLAADLRHNTTTLLGSHLILSDRQLDMMTLKLLLTHKQSADSLSSVAFRAACRLQLTQRIIGGLRCDALDVAVMTFMAELSPTTKRGMPTAMAGAGAILGGNVLVANSSRILRMTYSPLPNDLTSIIIMAFQMAACGVYLSLVGRIGRSATLLSYLMMSAAMIGMTAYVANVGVSFGMNSSSQTKYFESNITNLSLHGPSLTTEAGDQYPGDCRHADGAPTGSQQLDPADVFGGGSGCLCAGPLLHPYLLGNENFPSLIRPQANSICISAGTLSCTVNLQIFTAMLEAVTARSRADWLSGGGLRINEQMVL